MKFFTLQFQAFEIFEYILKFFVLIQLVEISDRLLAFQGIIFTNSD